MCKITSLSPLPLDEYLAVLIESFQIMSSFHLYIPLIKNEGGKKQCPTFPNDQKYYLITKPFCT
jgi:hypothetical protein